MLRLHNPDRANALTPAMLLTLARQIADPPSDVRLVVLTGAGDRHFSAGIDLRGADGPEMQQCLLDGETALSRATGALSECPVPVVAAVNGAAIGGGLELALSCDWCVAVDTARLGMPAARLGVVYSPEGLLRFLECIGPAHTRRLFLTGRPVDAAAALRMGLVDDVVPSGDLDGRVAEIIGDVTAGAPGAIAATRAAITILARALMPEAVQDVDRMRRAAHSSPEFAEALAARAEGREPTWSP